MADILTGLARAQQMVDTGEILYQKYLAEWALLNYDPGPTWSKQTLELASAGITEDDGIIISLEGTKRDGGAYPVDRGQVISPEQADQIQNFEQRRVSRYIVYDFRVVAVEPTTGPQERAELMESFEARKKRLRTEESEKNEAEAGLGTALKELTSYLKGEKGEKQELEPQAVFDYLKDNFSAAQVQDMMSELVEQEAPEEKEEAKPKAGKK